MNVISQDDILRMKALVSSDSPAVTRDELARKRELKRRSDGRVSRWSDTLASKRTARIEWKEKKAALREERRRALDVEEAQRRRVLHEETIKRANDLLYEERDRVKVLRSQQLYTEVVAERGEQIKEKHMREERIIEEEKKWHEDTMGRLSELERREKEEARARQVKAKEVALEMKRQMIDSDLRKAQQLQQKKDEEADTIKHIRKADLVAEQKAFQGKLEARKKATAEVEKLKLDREMSHSEEMKRQEAEAQKRAEQCAHILFMANARAALEKKHFEQRQATRKLLSDRAAKEIGARSTKESDLFLKNQRSRDAREKAKKEAESRARKELEDLILQSRKEQIKRRQEEKEAEARQSATLAHHLKKMAKEQEEQERREEEERRLRNTTIRKIQEEQYADELKRKSKEREDKLLREQEVFANLKREDDLFREFALKEIDKFKAHGKKTALLERAMNV